MHLSRFHLSFGLTQLSLLLNSVACVNIARTPIVLDAGAVAPTAPSPISGPSSDEPPLGRVRTRQTNPSPAGQPRLAATVVAKDDTNVTITLRNGNALDLLLLPWYSIFANGRQSQSLRLYDSTGHLVGPGSGERPAGKGPAPTDLTSFTTLPAGQNLTAEIDLSKVFSIPEAGDYMLQIQPAIIGGYKVPGANAASLANSSVLIDAANLTLPLTRGELTATSQDGRKLLGSNSSPFSGCSPEDEALVRALIGEAAQMARWALNPNDGASRGQDWDLEGTRNKFWGAYKDNPRIAEVYRAIGSYNLSSPPIDVTWICNRDGTHDTGLCASDSGIRAYTTSSTNTVMLCPPFFALPRLYDWIPSFLLWAENAVDQQGVILHEMTHLLRLVGGPYILDVPDEDWFSKWYLGLGFLAGDCYNYSCTVGLASSPWGGYTPMDNAQNYEYYAQTVRNCRFTGGCR